MYFLFENIRQATCRRGARRGDAGHAAQGQPTARQYMESHRDPIRPPEIPLLGWDRSDSRWAGHGVALDVEQEVPDWLRGRGGGQSTLTGKLRLASMWLAPLSNTMHMAGLAAMRT
jgi:hypothetical protein